MSHIELKYKIEEFLLYGVREDEDDDNVDAETFFNQPIIGTNVDDSSNQEDDHIQSRRKTVSLIQNGCEEYLSEMNALSSKRSSIPQQVTTLQEKILQLEGDLTQQDVVNHLQEYMKKKHHLQLLILSKTMQQLESCANILDIPKLILGVKHSMPKVLVEGSKIKKLVQSVVQNVRSRLLKKFHEFFEDQLNEEVNSMDQVNFGAQDRTKMWEVFLKRSRDWLLAFALVSILPYTLTHSSNYVLEKFQDAFDEALTPIWGRFYHHLKMSREAHSVDQIIWTFNYAKSFIEMLLNLSSQITQSDSLKEMYDLNYYEAARAQILEKSLKFLRAHEALILTEAMVDSTFLLRIIEESIEFDIWIYSHGTLIHGGMCSIIYESKETFHQWLAQEQSLLYQQLLGTLDNPFDLAFDSEIMDTKKTFRCYQITYHITTLFIQLRERYQHFPSAAQLILSEVILEPLLCFSLGLLLYKIRNDRILYHISIAQYDARMEDSNELDNFRVYCDSVSYFQTVLGASALPKIIADSKRCKKRWTILQNWIPKIFIGEQQQRQGFALTDLLRTAMKISDKYQSKSFDYRNEWQQKKGEVDSIEDCMIMTRGLAITLVDVLEKQMLSMS